MKNMRYHMADIARALATFVAAATLISLASCTGSTPADVEVGPYTVSVIEKNVYHIQDYNSSYPAGPVLDADGKLVGFNNCSDMYLLVGKKKALLIDLSNNIQWADNAAESLRQLVAERSEGRELIVTFTHNHGDHIGMLHAYTETSDTPSNDNSMVQFALPEKDFSALVSKFPAEQCSFINDGHVFELGGMNVDVVEVAGHTNGSVVFSIQGRNLMFTGDAIGSGQGVWIFHKDGYKQYAASVPQLIEWVENPSNGINTESLRIYGGHYWQRVGLPEMKEGEELGMTYLRDMNQLIENINAGTVTSEPANLGRPGLDTYFRHGTACIVWNGEQAKQVAAGL